MKEERQTSFAHRFDAEEAEQPIPINSDLEPVESRSETVADVIVVTDHEDDFPLFRKHVEEEISPLIMADLMERGYDQDTELYTQRNHLVVLFSEGEWEAIEDFVASDDERLELNLSPHNLTEILVNGDAYSEGGIGTNHDLIYVVVGLPENDHLPRERRLNQNLTTIAAGLLANQLSLRNQFRQVNMVVAGADGYRIFRVGTQ